MDLSVLYFPTAVALGALHALEPGHAKTLTAAYLIGTKGTNRDAVLLGLSVALTHSVVVIALAVLGVWLGKEAFTDRAMEWLQVASGVAVVLLGCWLLYRRWPRSNAHEHEHGHAHDHDEGFDTDEAAHARAHAATLPGYVQRGERPTALQIVTFGAAGGLVPCPAAVTVMLLAISVNNSGGGLLMVLGFSLGLALTLVGIGVAVVAGLNALGSTGRFGWFGRRAGVISAAVVIASGAAALVIARWGGGH